ncbi:MAG: hypothetical protein ACW963_08435 [Candidatus Sifarchaeia archaeon]|jgi:hypothetical protein
MAQNILENVKAQVYSDFYQRTLDDIIIYERKSSDLVDLSLLVSVCRNLLFDDHERLCSKIEQVNTNLGLDVQYVRHCSHKYPRCNARQMLETYEVPTSLIPKVIWGFQSVMLQFFFKIPSGHRFPVRCKTHAEILKTNDFQLTRINLSRGFIMFQEPQVEVELKFKGDWIIYIPYQIGEFEKLVERAMSSEMTLLQPRLQTTGELYIMARLVWDKKMSPKDADENFAALVTQNGFEIGKKMFPIFFLSHPKLETLKDIVQEYQEDIKEITFDSITLRNTIDLTKDISKAKEISEELLKLLQ